MYAQLVISLFSQIAFFYILELPNQLSPEDDYFPHTIQLTVLMLCLYIVIHRYMHRL